MSTDDFFSKIDAKIGNISDAEKANVDKREKNYAFLKTLNERVTPIAESYKTKLQERGIFADVRSNDYGFSFELKYKNGGYRRLELGYDFDTKNITFSDHYTNDDGKNYKTLGGQALDETNWNDSLFEKRLQKCIEDYLFYADRHGGVQTHP
jgi:hypothetical protein